MPELNAPQRQAVEHTSGPLLIFAGAGSGKTRTVTYRIANLLAQGVAPYRILAVTFTNKAAGEMRTRLSRLAGDEIVRDLWVGTFHSICARLLRRVAEEVGLTSHFVIYDESDQKAIVARSLKALGIDTKRMPPKYALGRIMVEKREGRTPEQAVFADDFDNVLAEVFDGYERALKAANAVDFEDLLIHVMRLAEDAESHAGEELRRRFEHVLVDEFQDTNAVQYRLVRALATRRRNLCVVGDDDQSIYRWRGADVRLIRGFRRDFPDATVIKLEQNYRSSANIVAGALAVISRAECREAKALFTEAAPGDHIEVRKLRDERDEARFVALTIQNELSRGTNPREIAVFYRVHAQSRVLEEALRSARTNYQIIGGMKFFERAEVKDVLAYLRLIDNPASDTDLLRVINVPARGIGEKTVARILDTAQECSLSTRDALLRLARDPSEPARKKLLPFAELLERLERASRELSPHDLADLVVEASGYRQELQRQDSAEADARLGNIEELLGSLLEYQEEASESGLEPTLSGYLERVSLVAAVDTLEDAPKVSLMTVHSAKGLEFDCVLLTGMEEEIFPYQGMDASEAEELDEERRLAYVAITRAKRRLFVTHVGVRSLFGRARYLEPSRFLSDLPADVVRYEGGVDAARAGSGRPLSVRTSPPRGAAPRPVPEARGGQVLDTSAFDDLALESSEGVETSESGPQGRRGFRRGGTVRHLRFGYGVVREVDGAVDLSVLVDFEDGSTRKIRAEFLKPA